MIVNAPPVKSKRPLIIGLCIGIVVVLCACVGGGSALLWSLKSDDSDNSAKSGGKRLSPTASASVSATKPAGSAGAYGSVTDLCTVLDFEAMYPLGVGKFQSGKPPTALPGNSDENTVGQICDVLLNNDGGQVVVASLKVSIWIFQGEREVYNKNYDRVKIDAVAQARRYFVKDEMPSSGLYGPGPAMKQTSGVGELSYDFFSSKSPPGQESAEYLLKAMDSNVIMHVEVGAVREKGQRSIGEFEPVAKSIANKLLESLRV